MKARTFFYRLFFTRDDGLDVSQLVLIGLYGLFAVLIVNVSRGVWNVPPDMIDAFLWVFGVATIQASPTWLAMALINSRALNQSIRPDKVTP